MRYGSLFSGACDGLSLGFEWACVDRGIDCELGYQVEIDEWCRTNLARHWPSVRRFDDVRNVGLSTLGHVDAIVGGFPCQDLSLAGKGKGLSGERSGLWFEYLRIIQETQPRGILIENVPGLLRRGLDVVIEGLVDVGYAVEATRIKASDVGAPHKRERVFIVAYSDGAGPQGSNQRSEEQPVVARCGSNALAYSGRAVLRDESGWGRGTDGSRAGVVRDDCQEAGRDAQPGLGRDATRLPDRVDRFPAYRGEAQAAWEPPRVLPKAKYPARSQRLKALGNAVVPQCAYIAAHRLLEKIT